MIEIPLTKGQTTIVDDIDADLAELKWYALDSSKSNSALPHYIAIRAVWHSAGKRTATTTMHRLILERSLGRKLNNNEVVDHINGESLDNRRNNLRPATRIQNAQNARIASRNSSGFKGVSYTKTTGKWRAVIKVNRVQKHLGYYPTPQEAYAAYCEAAEKYFGEFARPETAEGVQDAS